MCIQCRPGEGSLKSGTDGDAALDTRDGQAGKKCSAKSGEKTHTPPEEEGILMIAAKLGKKIKNVPPHPRRTHTSWTRRKRSPS